MKSGSKLLGSRWTWLIASGIFVVVAGGQRSLFEAAKGLFERRNYPKAEELLRQVLEVSPSDAPALVLLGRVKATVGHLGEAESLYRKAIKESPSDASAPHALAKLFAFQKRWDEAKESFARSLALDEDNAEGWLGMGRVSMALEDTDAAERYYMRSLELDPNSALLHFDLGVLNCKLGQVTAAEKAFAKSGELNPSLDSKVVAQMFVSFDMIAPARSAYKRVIEKEPTPENLFAYGELAEALGEDQEALDAYDSACRRNPGMGKAHLKKALLLTGCGSRNLAAVYAFGLNTEEAKRHLKEAVSSGEDRVAGPAAEALAWCEMEEQEVERWRQVGSAMEEDRGTRAAAEQGCSRIESDGVTAGQRAAKTPRWVDNVGGFLAIPEVVLTGGTDEFRREFVNKSQPAVFKNMQEGFAYPEAWSWAALEERFGDNVVRVSLSETGRFDGPEDGPLWGLPPGEEVLVRPPGTSMTFADFVRLLRAQNMKETFYLEYMAVHQYLGRPLQVPCCGCRYAFQVEQGVKEAKEDMIPLPAFVAQSGLELLLTNLWMGKGGTTAVLHYDDYENLLFQIRGTKELVLFPPSDLENLYYVGRRKGKLKYEYPGKWLRDELDGSNKVFFSSSVLLDDPDFRKHPRLKRCRPYHVTLREGDVLYMPAYWHHEVRSYPDEDEGNVAVNFWFRNVTYFAEEEQGLGGGLGSANGYSEL